MQRRSELSAFASLALGSATLISLTVALAVPPPAANAASKGSSSGPSFSAAQATSGQGVYTANCQGCHGANLQGGAGPALMGTGFTAKWANGNHQLTDLYDVIAHQMPLNAPGSLSQKQYLDVTAYILSKNGYSAGATALSTKTLKVKLTAPAKSKSADAPAAPAGPAATNLPKSLTAKPGQASGNAPSDAELNNVPDGEWLTYNRTLSGERYSPLNQITAANVKNLQVKCVFQVGETGAFQTGPVVYKGMLYLTTPRNTYAIKADTCTKVWESDYKPTGAEPFPVNRGVALYDGKLFRGTTDGHLIALDAATGKTLWNTWMVDSTKGYFMSAAPVAYNGKVYMGAAGADWGANGVIGAFDADTGKPLWNFDVIPTGKEPGAETWEKGAEHGGGSIWTSLTLDSASHLLYVSIGNPAPDLNGGLRPGANLYTDSVVVLDTNTGKLAWYAQQVPHDTHDWDTAAAPIIYQQNNQKLMAVANKGGWLYLYDRATHKLVSQQEITTHLNADKPTSLTGRRDCPGTLGGAEWNGPALDPANNMLFVNSVDWCATYKIGETRYVEGGFFFGGSATADPAKDGRGWTRAFNATTGEPMWSVKMPTPMIAAVTPTAGGVVFTGNLNGDFLVLDAKSGQQLYSFRTGGAVAGGLPTYTVNGQQYVAVASGNASRSIWSTTGAATIFVFGVPQ
ncbi:PQQ-binding-like beta-propeller repeat protein [Deinococcus irradiatisoli]|nr:PQQ-binding-like beta-propeller repeat protein [Deinococcus irradiatisoli]